ncbi:MAG: hypothetical protein LBI72_05430 [Flavobacteriaceae bacterium]|jgi:hypothetical protein|nr:hypothetical protein [Flavobacteriaceae bacterium]
MKNNILYIILILVLCFGFKAQAQNIVAYETKLKSLSNVKADELNHLVNGATTAIFVTEQNAPELYIGKAVGVSVMRVRHTSDFVKLESQFKDVVKEVTLLDVEWNGKEEIILPVGLLEKMSNLKYIYIRSYDYLDSTVIKNKFSVLIKQLQDNLTIEVLFYTMEKPS